ncbi:phage baseplate protein [Oculatella sp. LEGE 06141]|nr:phage baseplate protein [Oculatella sp. LEGE 06141]
MHTLSTSELLHVWERGVNQSSIQRALLLLMAAVPHLPLDKLAQLSIGQRDACLLTLREWTFGSQLACLVHCPCCGDRLELSLNVSDIRLLSEITLDVETFSLTVGDYDVCYRLPNSLDVASLTHPTDLTTASDQLLHRCLLTAHHQGEVVPIEQIPAAIVDTVVTHMAETDSQADIQLALSCPVCQHHWQSVFDIVSFFWSEINTWAYRQLREVHVLASAYGWREADILAMTPWRRQLYLNMIGQ